LFLRYHQGGECEVGQRSAGKLDVEIGRRLRERRRELDLSQEHVAEALGVTFQQLQKYESGANRLSASRLCRIADVLESLPEDLLPRATAPRRVTAYGGIETPNSAGARAVIDAFFALSTRDQRSCLLAMLTALMPSDGENPDARRRTRQHK
jgi:transcriptional regulator with XRE-family HTH domain